MTNSAPYAGLAATLAASDYSFAGRMLAAWEALRPTDGWPREANHVHWVASVLNASGFAPVLEVDYWDGYLKHPGKCGVVWPRADIWWKAQERDCFAEVKVARLGNSSTIGGEGQSKIVAVWADDIYRLLAYSRGANCAFVLSLFGENEETKFQETEPLKLRDRRNVNADEIWKRLVGCAGPSAADALGKFLKTCATDIGASVSVPSSERRGSLWAKLIVVEWRQRVQAKSACFHSSGGAGAAAK